MENCGRSVSETVTLSAMLSFGVGGLVRSRSTALQNYYPKKRKENIFIMGKAQRSKNKKAASQLANPSAFVEKNNTGKGLKIAFAIIALVVVASLIATAVLSSGLLLRADYGYRSENFEIDGAMMQYLYHSQIYSFLETYYYYIYYYSLMGQQIVDFSRPLDTQKFNSTAQSLFGSFDGTWFDFFWEKTEAQAKQIVVLCEAAKADGLYDGYKKEATETAKKSMEGYKEVAKTNFSSLSAYFEYLYGKGVKKGDVEDIEILQQIASLYYTDKYEETKDAVYANKDGIKKQYDDNKSKYLMADYVVASFSASLKTNATEDEKAEFLKKVEEAKAHAEAVSKLESVDAINKYLVEYWFEETYKTTFDEAFKKDKVAEDKIPKDEEFNTIKEKIKAEVLEKAFDEEYDETKDSKLFDLIDYKDTYKTLNTIVTSFIKTSKTSIESVNIEGDMHAEATDFDKWLFAEDRKVGDIGTFYGTTDSKEDKFDASKDKTYVVNVIYVTEPVHRDETPSVEFGHILLTNDGEFKTEVAQKEKLIALKEAFEKGDKTKEAFEALGKDVTEDSQVIYDDVLPDQMVEEMNDWLFDEARKAGDVEIIKTASYGQHLVFYVGSNAEEPVWFINARADLLNDTFEDWYEALEKKYEGSIKINNKIGEKMSSANGLLGY